MALGKVASYIKNLGKSVAYASIDTFDKAMPAVKEYREANATVAKEIYHAITNFRGTVKKVGKYTQESLIYEVFSSAAKNAWEDLQTGNFYNKEREIKSGDEAAKAQFGDFGSDDDLFKDLDNMFGGEDFKDLDAGDKATIRSIEGTSRATANTIANAAISSAKYTSEVSKVNTNILFAQQERLFGQLNSGISTMNDNVNTINKFNMDVFQKHIDNSTKFFESTTKNVDTMRALLQEIRDMYKKEYDARDKIAQANDKAMAARKHHEDDPMSYNQLVGASGAVDFGAYFKHVRNQTYKQLNQYSPMGKIFGPEADQNARNMVKTIADNPLDWAISSTVKGLMGPALKHSMSYFNDMVSGIFGTAMTRLNSWVTNGEYDTISGTAKEIIGKLFGTADLKNRANQSLDTSKYTKGAIPFDGITKKAIVDVIPELLGDILAELTGGDHRRFDFQAGKWTSLEYLTKQDVYKRRVADREAASMFDHIMYDPDKLALMAKDKHDQKAILKAYEEVMKNWFINQGGDIRELHTLATTGNNKKAEKLANKLWGPTINTALAKLVSHEIDKAMDNRDRMMAGHQFRSAVGRANDMIKNAKAETGVDMDRYLANGAADTLHQRKLQKHNGQVELGSGEYSGESLFDKNGNKRNNFKYRLAFEVDEHDNSIFTYLQNIDANLAGLFNTATNFALDHGSAASTINKALYDSNNRLQNHQYKTSLLDLHKRLDKRQTDNKTNWKMFRNKLVLDILENDVQRLSFDNIDADNIDKIISDKTKRLKYLQSLSGDQILALEKMMPADISINGTIVKLMGDIQTLQNKRKYIIGTTRSSSGSAASNFGSAVINRKSIINSKNKTKDDENAHEKFVDDVIAKAADRFKTTGYNPDGMVAIFNRMLEANGEDQEGNGKYTSKSTLHDANSFYSTFDNVLNQLGEYGFDYDSPEGKMLVNQLKAKWDRHYKIKAWTHEEYGKGNPIFRFSRGITAENNLKAKYSGREDFDWDEFDKKSFADKLSSVDSLGDKFDVIMLSVGKMVEVPARMMSDVFRSAGDSIHNFFFEDDTEYVDKEGNKIKGFFGLMKAKTANALDSFVQGFDKHFWTPIKEQFGLAAGSLSDSLGITWLTEKYGKATKNAFVQLGDNINEMLFSGIAKEAEKQYEKDKAASKGASAKSTGEESTDTKTAEAEKLDILHRLIPNWEQQQAESVEEKATGARMINKSGLTAISKGEMIIPSELNPFYKGITNKQAEIRNEKNIKSGLGKYVSSMIGMNAEGKLSVAESESAPTDADAYLAVLANLEHANPKVYNEVMDIVNTRAGKTMTYDAANERVIDILKRHKDDRTPEDQREYERQIDAKAEGKFIKRVTSNMQAGMTKIVLNTKNPTVIKMWDNFIKNDAETVGNGIAGGTIGALAGLLTGFGPLAGMVVGAGANIVMGSETVKSALFGEKDLEGNRSGGALLSATEYRYLSKLIPDIGKFGLIGAGAGLVGLAPFGILGGLGIGAMAAFAKNNSSFMESMFGDVDGIINKDKQDFLKKAFPNMALGSVAAFALGPFGLLGSIVLGSAGGMVATSEKFKSLMLGDKLWTGERSGGLLGELKDKFVSPIAKFAKDFTTNISKFVYNDIIKPFADGVGPIVRITGIAVKNTAKALMDGAKKIIGLGPSGGMIKDIWSFIAAPIIKTVGKVAKGTIEKATGIAKPIVSFPSKMVQKLGNKAKRWMIDNSYSAGMTANERLAERKLHKYGIVGKGSIAADNDIAMLGMKDDQLVEAENLASYLASNGKGTEDALTNTKNKFKINLRSLLGKQDLTNEQEQLVEDLLSNDADTRTKAEAEMEKLFKRNHLHKNKDVKNAYQTTLDVMRKQHENLATIKTDGMDAAKKKFEEMGFRGDPAKILSLLSNEVKHRNIFGKLTEASENYNPADKQINATEQIGENIVDQTKQSGEEVRSAVDQVGEILLSFQENFEEYMRNPEKFKEKANEYTQKIRDIEKKIADQTSLNKYSGNNNVLELYKLKDQKKKLLNEQRLYNLFGTSFEDEDNEETNLAKDLDEIMTNKDTHHFGKKDLIKFHKNWFKGDIAKNIRAVKSNHLWTDSFSTIMNMTEDQRLLLDPIGKLHNDYAEKEPNWSLEDALSLNNKQVGQIDPLMKSKLLPNKLGWYVDHKNSLNDFQTAVDEYNKLYASAYDKEFNSLDGEETDINGNIVSVDALAKSDSRVRFMDKAIADAQKARNSKDASNILNSAAFQMDFKKIKDENPDINLADSDIKVLTNPETGTPMQYIRSTDGEFVPYDQPAREWDAELKKRKRDSKKNPFGYNSENEFERQKHWINTKELVKSSTKNAGKFAWRKTKEAGGLLSAAGGLFSSILGPLLGGGGMITAGILGGGYLLGKVPGLAEFAGNVLVSGVDMLAKAAGSVFSYVIEHASDIVSSVYNAIKTGLTTIVKIAFGMDRDDAALKTDKNIDHDQNGYFTIDKTTGQKRYLSPEEVDAARKRKSVFGAVRDVVGDVWNNSGGWGKTGMVLGGAAATAYTGYRMYKGASRWGNNIKNKWGNLQNAWDTFTGKSNGVNKRDTSGLPEEFAQNIESTDENTAAIKDLTNVVLQSNGILSDSSSTFDTNYNRKRTMKNGKPISAKNQTMKDLGKATNLSGKKLFNRSQMKFMQNNGLARGLGRIAASGGPIKSTIAKAGINTVMGASNGVTEMFKKFANLDIVKNTIGRFLSGGPNSVPKIIMNFAKNIGPNLAKLSFGALGFGIDPISLAWKAATFLYGMAQAREYYHLDDTQDVSIGQRIKAGIANFICNGLLWWVPGLTTETLLSWVGSDTDKEIEKEAINNTDKVSESNAETKSAVKAIDDKLNTSITTIKPATPTKSLPAELARYYTDKNPQSAKGKFGKGYYKQIDPIISNTRFNAKGDTQYQTIGDSGCGPIAAVNALYGTGPNPLEASDFALKNGYKEVNGGTKPGFFKSYFNKNGKDAEYTQSKENILKNLQSGNKVVLEGQSNKIDTDTPFGTGPHYVTATGLDRNGNMIIQDPQDKRANLAYNADKVLSKTKFGVTAKGKYGRGAEDYADKIIRTLGDLFGVSTDDASATTNNGYVQTNGSNNISRAWKFFRHKGFSPEATAGILGNFMQESSMDPAVHQDYKNLGPNPVDGVGFGIAQWTFADRQNSLVNYANKMKQPVNTLDPQLNFVYKEMEDGGPVNRLNVQDYRRSIGDPGKYAYLFHRDYEISADSEAEVRKNRGGYADQIYNNYKGMAGAGKYGRGMLEDQLNSATEGMLNSLLGSFGYNSSKLNNGNSGANREAQKVANHIDKRAINEALDWANKRVDKVGEGNNGCTAFVNQFLTRAHNSKSDWMWVPNVVQDAKLSSIWKDPYQPAKPGDIAILETDRNTNNGADHAVIATGDGGYIGNSSSRNKIWRGNLGSDFGAENVVGYVATGDPDYQGTVTTGKLRRTEKEVIGDSGSTASAKSTTAASGKFGRGKFEPQASVDDFIRNDDNIEFNKDIDKVYEKYQKNTKHASEQTALAGKGSSDYTDRLDQIITLLSQIEANTKGGTEIGSKNSEALSRIAKQTAQAKRLLRNNPSGAGRITANDSLEDIDDMMGSLYQLAQR